MKIEQANKRGKLNTGVYYTLLEVVRGIVGVSTGKGAFVTLVSLDRKTYVTISASEFALMREWFDKNGCEE
jgi:hypothetical protein